MRPAGRRNSTGTSVRSSMRTLLSVLHLRVCRFEVFKDGYETWCSCRSPGCGCIQPRERIGLSRRVSRSRTYLGSLRIIRRLSGVRVLHDPSVGVGTVYSRVIALPLRAGNRAWPRGARPLEPHFILPAELRCFPWVPKRGSAWWDFALDRTARRRAARGGCPSLPRHHFRPLPTLRLPSSPAQGVRDDRMVGRGGGGVLGAGRDRGQRDA